AGVAGRGQLPRKRTAPTGGRPAGRGGAGAALRRRLGVDGQPVRRLPRLPAAAGRPGRVQRQVHVQPGRAARPVLRHAAAPLPGHLPHLLPARPPLAVFGLPPGEARMTTHTASPPASAFLRDVLRGLSRARKRLPCKYFYDTRGSALFDEICRLDEYYP